MEAKKFAAAEKFRGGLKWKFFVRAAEAVEKFHKSCEFLQTWKRRKFREQSLKSLKSFTNL
jgi:hypothetical protein